MRTSVAGIELIKKFEGCRLMSYKCPAGVWTIGYGHTGGVKQGQTITQSQAEQYLISDLAKFEAHVEKFYKKYCWNQNEFDAMVSFAYNIGSINQLTAFGTRSKDVVKEKIKLYNKAGGKVLPGLVRRRQAEYELFTKNVESAVTQVPGLVSNLYYPKSENHLYSLVDALKAINVDSSYANRKKIAKVNGIANYKGTSSQNLSLYNLLANGMLKKV